LLNVSGTLYGTTYEGGQYDRGTVFSVSTGGDEQVLHSFGGSSSDGHWPVASLINVDGTLYGTTEYGGTDDKGTIFSVTLSGTEKVLHSFQGRRDGAEPVAALVDVNHTLYGTTVRGGPPGPRVGTIFSSTTSGEEHVIHSFGTGSGGESPEGGLINVKGMLYGTTAGGGTYGYGTVFALTP
jgi:uncharacterized repeat protein (TIGR03803 family)